jgi:hypothetical protein
MNTILRDAVEELRLARQGFLSVLVTLLKYTDDMPVEQIPLLLDKVFKQAGYKQKRTETQAKEYADTMDSFGVNALDDEAKKIV